jgi:hypothetical protein
MICTGSGKIGPRTILLLVSWSAVIFDTDSHGAKEIEDSDKPLALMIGPSVARWVFHATILDRAVSAPASTLIVSLRARFCVEIAFTDVQRFAPDFKP